jgi:hypothetical protein
MRFTLSIDCDNDAFYPFVSQEDGGSPAGSDELVRIVQRVADCVATGDDSGACYDTNGNRVGAWMFEEWPTS